MKTLPLSPAQGAHTHWSIALSESTTSLYQVRTHTHHAKLEDPRARPVVLFSPRSVSLQRRRQDLGSFHVARGRETALCEHPLCRHLTFLHHQYLRPLLLLSFIVLTSRHHCYPQQTLAVGWIVSQG